MASFLSRSDGMLIEDQLRERLKKVEALYFGAAAEGQARGGQPSRSSHRDEVQLARPMVGPVVHRVVPALWRSAVPIPATALDDDYGQGTATLFRQRGVAAIFRPAHGPLALFRADDGAADPGGYPRRYRGRRDDG